MRADVSSRRVAAFVKRLLQVSSSGTSNFAAGSLFLVSELLKVRNKNMAGMGIHAIIGLKPDLA